MHLLMLLESEFPTDVRVENEASILLKSGHRVTLLVPSFRKQPQEENYQGLRVVRFQIPKKFFFMLRATAVVSSLYHRFWVRQIRTKTGLESVDALHIHDLPLARTGGMICGKKPMPLILDLHENFPALLKDSGNTRGLLKSFFFSPKRWNRYERESVQKASRIIVVVDEAADRIQHLGVPSNKIRVVSNTPVLEKFLPVPVSEKNEFFTISYIGGFGPHRGLETAIKSMAVLSKRYPEARLLLIGGAKKLKPYFRLIDRLGVSDQVRMIGWIPFREVSRYIALSDVCLVPHAATDHTNSTIPHKLFQYMAMGKPVIVSDCRPLKRIVEETRCGLVFKSDDPQKLADCIEQMFDESRRILLGKNGRKAVLDKYHWNRDGQALIRMYKTLEA